MLCAIFINKSCSFWSRRAQPWLQCLKEWRENTRARSVTLSVAGNSHKEAVLGDKMFYVQPQSVASKWQDSRILSLDLVSDVSCGWAGTRAIAAARRVSERCSLGAEARSALQNFACTVPGEERGQNQPIRRQDWGREPIGVQSGSTLPVASARLSQQ